MDSVALQSQLPWLDLKPHITNHSLCTHPCWDLEDLSRKALQSATVKKGDLMVEDKRKYSEDLMRTGYNGHYAAGHGTLEKPQEDFYQAVKLVGILKACAVEKDLQRGSIIHDEIARRKLFEQNVFVGNAVVNMYAKCGALGRAQEVFNRLLTHDVVSWNTLIAGYAQHGYGAEALHCFEQMVIKGFSPTAITYVCILKACASLGAVDKGQQVHAKIVKEGLLDVDILIANALIDMYGKCGLLQQAQDVFYELQFIDSISWNTLISGYAHHDIINEALDCFYHMQREGFSPTTVTFVCVLKACANRRAASKGQGLHAEIVKEGLLDKDLNVGTALVDMYGKCGMLVEARDVFEELPFRDVVSWTALITGYAQHEDGEQALVCFERMQRAGFSPNAFTFGGVLKACGSLGAAAKGQEIHAKILREGLLERDYVVASALVDMYAKWGLLQKTQEVFDEVRVRDMLTWNSLIGGYALHEHGETALHYFEKMRLEGFSPDAVTFASVFRACGSIGAVNHGHALHAEIVVDELVEKHMVVGTALVDMYANCGMLIEAQEVFERLTVQDAVAWNALLVGYVQLGLDGIVFSLFNKMIKGGKEPSLVTFIIVLNACSHRGLVDLGQLWFETLSRCYGIVPTLEHYSCMVDLFGRAGHLGEAIGLMGRLPFPASPALWHTLLGACLKWGHTIFGTWVFQHAFHLNENDGAAYVYMNNIHAAACTEDNSNA